MLHAVSFALMDSLNVLLIGLIVAVGVMLPARAPYRRIVSLLVLGDWLGVYLLALATMFVFGGIQDAVQALIDSPIFGLLLILVGLAGAILTWRGGDNSGLVEKLLPPLQTPTAKTFIAGFLLGVAQSITSGPFFAGIAYLSVEGYSDSAKYVAMFFYACLALSLPALTALGVGFVRRHPASALGRGFAFMREHSAQSSVVAGYFVSVVLVVMGLFHL